MKPPIEQRACLHRLTGAHVRDQQRVLDHLSLRARSADSHYLVRDRLQNLDRSGIVLIGERQHRTADRRNYRASTERAACHKAIE